MTSNTLAPVGRARGENEALARHFIDFYCDAVQVGQVGFGQDSLRGADLEFAIRDQCARPGRPRQL